MLNRIPKRSLAYFKNVTPLSTKKGNLHRQGYKINPSLLRFAAETDGIV